MATLKYTAIHIWFLVRLVRFYIATSYVKTENAFLVLRIFPRYYIYVSATGYIATVNPCFFVIFALRVVLHVYSEPSVIRPCLSMHTLNYPEKF